MFILQNIDRYSRKKSVKRNNPKLRPLRSVPSGWVSSLNYLEPEREVLAYSNSALVKDLTISSTGLNWKGASSIQLQFIKKVYDINLARNTNRTFVNDVPDSELSVVEGRYKLRKEAAKSAKDMLKAIREAIASAQKNVTVGVNSAYRPASSQFRLWNEYVTNQYYPDTTNYRKGLEGGEHGDKAADYLARYTRGRIATPGYSNHNNGLAIDISNIEDGKRLRNKTNKSDTDKWRQSWLWSWLSTNAAKYNFYQDNDIDEPWHWVYTAAATSKSLDLLEGSLFGGPTSLPPLTWPKEADYSPNYITSDFLKIINYGNGMLAIQPESQFFRPQKEIDQFIGLLQDRLTSDKESISESIISMAGLNSHSVITELQDKLRASSNLRRLNSIPEIVQPMAARMGLLLAWIDIAIRRKASEDISEYQSEYNGIIDGFNSAGNASNYLSILGLFGGNIISAISAGIALLDFSFGRDIPKDKSLAIYRSSEKLRDYFRKLQSAIFDNTLDRIIIGEDRGLLGFEFKKLKLRYADGVIGARQREIDRFSKK